jgi:hypothetical protein
MTRWLSMQASAASIDSRQHMAADDKNGDAAHHCGADPGTRRAARLRSAVLEYGGQRVVVIGVPWYVTPPKIAEAMTEEEAKEPTHARNVLGFHRHRPQRARRH